MTRPNEREAQELARLKAYYPYRIVFGVVRSDTGAWESWAKHDRRAMNRLARQGHAVYVMESGQ